jgi:hypothetical protein
MITKTGPLTEGHTIRTHWNSNTLLENLTTNNYKGMSMRNSSICLILTSENVCVGSQ